MMQNNTLNETLLSEQPIGVMDSGVGGLSVLKHIHDLLPLESLCYVADSKYAPYGNRSAQEIQARCIKIAEFLIKKKAKALVVACNTATAAAIETLRQTFDLPIIGMEPAVKPAVAVTKNGVVGVLATVGTLKSGQFAALLESYGRDVKIITQACVSLVECIERGELNNASTYALVKQYCQPLIKAGADTIVLGCTHYPFIKPLIIKALQEQGVADKVILIDTGAAVAKQCQRRLAENKLLVTEARQTPLSLTFWTNSIEASASEVIQTLWVRSAGSHISYQDF